MQTDKIPRHNISKAELFRAGEILRDEYAILNSQEWGSVATPTGACSERLFPASWESTSVAIMTT